MVLENDVDDFDWQTFFVKVSLELKYHNYMVFSSSWAGKTAMMPVKFTSDERKACIIKRGEGHKRHFIKIRALKKPLKYICGKKVFGHEKMVGCSCLSMGFQCVCGAKS